MAQMAVANDVIRGTFKAETSGTYTINFGRSIDRYFVYFEMTEESKILLDQNANGSNKTFGFVDIKWEGFSNYSDYQISYEARTNGSSITQGSTTSFVTKNADNITFTTTLLTSGAHYIYTGYTYNYVVVPIYW